ncbi:MAG: hypothetical protein PHC97_04465 [Patescibacteria group bacterium]|nr:hypothetical protein [Patescibacteria group bacterium]
MKEIIKDLSFLELFVLNTLVYFDIFDYPLTLLEIDSYLYTGGMDIQPVTLDDIRKTLEESEKLRKIIATRDGFYFLNGRDKIIQTRLERYNLAEEKFKIARRALSLIKFLPFVKLVAVCNNLAYKNARQESDIDFFVVSGKNRLYLTRLLVTAAVSLLGLRRHKSKISNRICLSFYASEENLDFSGIKITAEDVYLCFWLATLWPAYQRENSYQTFCEKNLWLKKSLPNFEPLVVGHRYRVEDRGFNKFIYRGKELILKKRLGDFFEAMAKKLQMKIMVQKKKDLAILRDNKVIISETMLKFHENDRRLSYQQEFERRRLEILNNL